MFLLYNFDNSEAGKRLPVTLRSPVVFPPFLFEYQNLFVAILNKDFTDDLGTF